MRVNTFSLVSVVLTIVSTVSAASSPKDQTNKSHKQFSPGIVVPSSDGGGSDFTAIPGNGAASYTVTGACSGTGAGTIDDECGLDTGDDTTRIG